MEAITFHAFFIPDARDGVTAMQGGDRRVERRVEACDLRHLGVGLDNLVDNFDVERLMQRRERDQRLQVGEEVRAHDHVLFQIAPVHDAVANRSKGVRRQAFFQPAEQRLSRAAR